MHTTTTTTTTTGGGSLHWSSGPHCSAPLHIPYAQTDTLRRVAVPASTSANVLPEHTDTAVRRLLAAAAGRSHCTPLRQCVRCSAEPVAVPAVWSVPVHCSSCKQVVRARASARQRAQAVELSMMLFGDLLRGGALFNLYLSMHGGHVSSSAVVNSIRVSDHDLLRIGDDVVIAEDAVPHPLYYVEGEMHIEKVHIAEGAVMGERSILLGGAAMESHQQLQPLE
eukprot:4897-Heterococcus_DN1.PRE.2